MGSSGTPPSLGAEIALLLACTRAHLDPATASRVRELASAVSDWPALVDLAHRHRLVPLLYTHLRAVADDIVPPRAFAVLRDEFTANAARNLALAVELLAVTELLHSQGIRALPYKGPTLAQCIYGSLATRQMKDVDVLVRPADVGRALALLATRGYAPVTRPLPGAGRLGLEYQCVLTRPTDSTIIEVHWSVVPRTMAPPVTLDQLWPNRLHTAMLGRTLPSPSHEDMLVILCIHGAKHRWARLEWICGVAELLRSKPLDWVKVEVRAERWRATRMLRTGLLLAADLLGAPVPDGVASMAGQDARAVALARSVLDGLFIDEEAIVERLVREFQLRTQQGMLDRARYVCFRPLIDGARRGARFAHWLQQAAAQ